MLLVKDAKWTLWRKIYSFSKCKMILLAFLATSMTVGCYFLHQVLGKSTRSIMVLLTVTSLDKKK